MRISIFFGYCKLSPCQCVGVSLLAGTSVQYGHQHGGWFVTHSRGMRFQQPLAVLLWRDTQTTSRLQMDTNLRPFMVTNRAVGRCVKPAVCAYRGENMLINFILMVTCLDAYKLRGPEGKVGTLLRLPLPSRR